MSTEQITEERVDEVVETELTELEGGYTGPAITIRKTYSIGDVDEHTTVEIGSVKDYPTTGDLTVVVEAILNALVGTDRHAPKGQQLTFHVSPLPPGAAAGLAAAIRRMSRPEPAPLTAEQLEAELVKAEEHDAACDQDHTTWIDNLRNLILQARADKAASDRAERTRTESEPLDTTPPGDAGDLADAAQGDATATDATADTCPGGC